MAYIYKITNDINGKVYVGKTEHSIERRFKKHCRDRLKRRCEKRPLYSAMNKYGIEHFHVELIESTNNPNEREAFWIDKFNSYHNGYNATKGGDGKSYLNYDLIIRRYLEVQNIAEVSRELNIDRTTISNILHTNNIPIKSSQSIMKDTHSIKIVQLDISTGKELRVFSSYHELGKYLIKEFDAKGSVVAVCRHVKAVCIGDRKTAFGYHWQFAS